MQVIFDNCLLEFDIINEGEANDNNYFKKILNSVINIIFQQNIVI